jgi:peptidoglycan/xylan/chitin deacetylase (PgdA/CDA1 family)
MSTPKAAIPVLMYHALTDGPDARVARAHVPVEVFEAQMRWLARGGFRALTAADVVDALAGTESPPPRGVAVTFDDGYLSSHRRAAPILARLSFTATLFLTTDAVGLPSYREIPAFRDSGQPPDDRPLRWPEIADLAAAGWAIEAHGCGHPPLLGLGDDALRHEVADCRAVIEQRLGRPVRFFAYPVGDSDRRARAAVRSAGYSAAFAAGGGLARHRSDLFRLPRIGVNSDDRRADFIRKVATGRTSLGDSLRTGLREWWYGSAAVRRLARAIGRRP